MQPFEFQNINNSLSCYIYPRPKFPNGLYLNYETCPETYDNQTAKIIRYCCLRILFTVIQDSLYKKTQDWLRYNSSSVLVVPAVLFNILSLIVLRRFQRLRGSSQTSTTFYMKCLCLFDTLTIVSKFLYEIIVVRNGLRENPIAITSFVCKFLSFSESLCAISSIYLLIAMTVDKLICVLAPLKVGQILTQTKARATFACILVCSAILSSYNLFDKRVFQFETSSDDSESSSNEETPKSNININQTYYNISNSNSSYAKLIENQTKIAIIHKKKYSYDCDSNWPERNNDWILINNIIRVFMPILLLCICNSWIVIALAKARKNTEALFSEGMTRTDDYSPNRSRNSIFVSQNGTSKVKSYDSNKFLKVNKKSTDSKRKSSAFSYLTDSDNELHNEEQQPNKLSSLNLAVPNQVRKSNMHIRGQKSTQHISIMLFAVSIGFVIFNLPFAIRTLFHRQFSERFKVLDYIYHDDNLFKVKTSKSEISFAIKYEFFSSLTHLLLDLNYIANFFLYFFSGSRFRVQLYSFFKCKDSSEPNKSYTNSHYLFNRIDNNLTIQTKQKKPLSYNPFTYLRHKLFEKKKPKRSKDLTFDTLTTNVGRRTIYTNVDNSSNRQMTNLLKPTNNERKDSKL